MMELDFRHQCLIYDGAPSRQLPALATMIQRKLEAGYRCLYLNSRPMVAGLRSYLFAIGVDVMTEVDQGRLVLSSESIASESSFDADLMLRGLEDAVVQALGDGYRGLWATGDMTWEFGSEKNFAKLVEYEYRLENLMRKQPALSGICQYHKETLPEETPNQALLTHRMIFINETLSRINPHYVAPGQCNNVPTNFELNEMVTLLCQLQSTERTL
jgi:hypothetical protein